MKLQEAFEYYFKGQESDGMVRCPYRVCPMGAHVDHQHGLVSGFALDKGVSLLYKKIEEPIVEMYSMNFEGRMLFTVKSDPHIHHNWGDYARAAMKSLFYHGYKLHYGFRGVIEGTLPIGGLSSSAAVLLTYMVTFCRVNDIRIERSELISMSSWAEKKFIGLNNGILDQSCEVYCKENHLLYLDTLDNKYENIRISEKMAPFRIGIFFSGLTRSLVNSAYNTRVDECRAGAYSLLAYAGLPYGNVVDTCLRDVPEEAFYQYKDRLPENFAKRAEHFFTENARVRKGIKAWKSGDIHKYGQLIFESGNSSIYNYESGSPELRKMHEIMMDTEGIYGGRFSGAGFKGCCMSILDPNRAEEIGEKVLGEYLAAFPELKGKASVHICDIADGITM